MNRFAAALASVLVALPSLAQAADACITLDVSLHRYNEYGELRERGAPGTLEFTYGDLMKIQIAGNLPGVFRMVSVNPAGQANFDFDTVVNLGRTTVWLPCGGAQACPQDNEFIVFQDDGGAAATEKELLTIYYFPCRTGDSRRDRVVAPMLNALESCEALIPAMKEGEFPIASYESLVTGGAKKRVCTPPRDPSNRVRLEQPLRFHVAR